MATPNKSVNLAFQKGLQTIYKELFQYIYLRFLDMDNTVVDDVFDETRQKVYLPPIKLLGHYQRERNISNESTEKTEETATFKVPVQEFYDHKIGFKSVEEIEKLRQAVIIYDGMYYQINEVNPRSVIAGDFLIVRFDTSPAERYIPDLYDTDEALQEMWWAQNA